MMGQQQETVVGSALVRRIVVVLAVAALMAAMVAAMAAPAFALRHVPNNPGNACTGLGTADSNGANLPETGVRCS